MRWFHEQTSLEFMPNIAAVFKHNLHGRDLKKKKIKKGQVKRTQPQVASGEVLP